MKGARLVQQTQVIRAMQAVQLGIQEELKPSDSAVYGVETNNSCFLHEAGTSPNWIAKPWKRWETVMSCKVSFALLMDSSDVLCFLRGLVGQGIPSGASPEFLSMIVWLVGDCSLDCHLHLLPSFPLLRSHLPRRQRPTTYIPGKSFEKINGNPVRYLIPKRQATKHYKVHFGSHRPSHNMAGKNAKICIWCPCDDLSST